MTTIGVPLRAVRIAFGPWISVMVTTAATTRATANAFGLFGIFNYLTIYQFKISKRADLAFLLIY